MSRGREREEIPIRLGLARQLDLAVFTTARVGEPLSKSTLAASMMDSGNSDFGGGQGSSCRGGRGISAARIGGAGRAHHLAGNTSELDVFDTNHATATIRNALVDFMIASIPAVTAVRPITSPSRPTKPARSADPGDNR